MMDVRFSLATFLHRPGGRTLACGALLAAALLGYSAPASAEDAFIPRKQSQPPGPPLTPDEALQKMTVPDGFTVQLVAAEPDVVNPVAMTFDDRGRIWVTESFEYPRMSAGPGRDRIKILEDTNGDGKIDSVKVFAEGLNIPSGIAVGHGGVWVANAPDLLFLEDTNGDDRADKQTVVVTGFGRTDTHELPNSLTWGPDGWLYGLNGVFNHSRVEADGQVHEFTCAMFRIDPRTHRFELFAEGTSNPWGIAFNPAGSAFVSACVIDHLWHLTESGYYRRQGGPYPPFTWHIESIVNHKHQMAAYCGLEYFDSEAYPDQYRDLLYMGNIHGGCINVDRLERRGSTYFAKPEEDFLTANDVWFMPVDQKVGPDGNLYILDWYDRYHCYQDAQADPEGVDRGHGRLYRVCYGDPKPAPQINLGEETSEQLVERLGSGNLFDRQIAQRLLAERQDEAVREKLQAQVLAADTAEKTRMHSLFALVGQGPLDEAFHTQLLEHDHATLRAWGVRAAGNQGEVGEKLAQRIAAMASDDSADVALQVAIAAGKIEAIDALPVLVDVLSHCGDDPLIPQVVWQNLHPLIPQRAEEVLELVSRPEVQEAPAIAALLPRITERMVAE